MLLLLLRDSAGLALRGRAIPVVLLRRSAAELPEESAEEAETPEAKLSLRELLTCSIVGRILLVRLFVLTIGRMGEL